MNTIAVDTSTSALIAAINTPSYSEEVCLDGQSFQHSEMLMNTIIDLCRKGGIKTKELDLLICTRGPGSFTGLRIAMSTLKGIAAAGRANVVSVSTLEMYARTVSDFDGLVVTAIDAKKQRYYIAGFECRNGQVKRVFEDTDGNPCDLDNVAQSYKKILVAGPDKENFAELLKERFADKNISTDYVASCSVAKSLLELGKLQFESKGADDIGQGPAYLRKSDAEEALEKKQKENLNG